MHVVIFSTTLRKVSFFFPWNRTPVFIFQGEAQPLEECTQHGRKFLEIYFSETKGGSNFFEYMMSGRILAFSTIGRLDGLGWTLEDFRGN
jgi:hypothetical protein